MIPSYLKCSLVENDAPPSETPRGNEVDDFDDFELGTLSFASSSMDNTTTTLDSNVAKYEGIEGHDDDDDDDDDNDDNDVLLKAQPRIQESSSFSSAWHGMILVYFRESSQGRWSLVLLVVLLLANAAEGVVISYLEKDFWTALGNQNASQFYRTAQRFVMALIFITPIKVLFHYQQQRLAIQWREWMTTWLLRLYFEKQQQESSSSNTLKNKHQLVDNPDQRLAEDLKIFIQHILSLFVSITKSFLDAICFSVILYTIRPTLLGETYLICWVGTLVAIYVGQTLARFNYERSQTEADFRFGLVRLFRQAPKQAQGEGDGGTTRKSRPFLFETTSSDDIPQQQQILLQRVLANARNVIATQRNLELVTTLYSHLSWLLPILILAPDYFSGAAGVELGTIQQAEMAFHRVLSACSFVIHEFETISEFSASKERLHQFVIMLMSDDDDDDEDKTAKK